MIDEIDIREVRMSLALAGIREGRYTIPEAEKFFLVTIPSDEYDSKESGFYFDPKTPDYYGWAKYFVDKNKFFTSNAGAYTYDNDANFYRRITDLEIQFKLTQDTANQVKPSHRLNFLKTLQGYSYKEMCILKNTDGLINLKNGYLNVKTGELKSHDSNLFFTYCLPHNYDPKAKSDKWNNFLSEVFKGNEELKIVAAQIFGYVLLGGHPWLHQAFVLYGEGRNGKSTFLDMLKELIGTENYSAVSLGRLGQPFSVIHIDRKLANIIEETPNDKINAEAFKTAIGGGHLMGSKKYENEYLFQCNARFIFACNELPRFSENSVGLHERLYFLPFNTYFEKARRNGNILNELRAELPGILNWALSGLDILLEDRRLPDCDASNQILEDYKTESDSVHEWASGCIIVDLTYSVKTKAKDLYCAYIEDLKNTGRRPVSDMTFFKRFKKYMKSRDDFDEITFDKRSKTYKSVRRQSN